MIIFRVCILAVDYVRDAVLLDREERREMKGRWSVCGGGRKGVRRIQIQEMVRRFAVVWGGMMR